MELANIDPQCCAGQLDDRSGKRKLGSRTKLGPHRAFAPDGRDFDRLTSLQNRKQRDHRSHGEIDVLDGRVGVLQNVVLLKGNIPEVRLQE